MARIPALTWISIARREMREPRGVRDAARLPWIRRALARADAEIRLTALAIWRGVTGIYHSNDLTFASSIAYYALLSLFPFFLLVLAFSRASPATTSIAPPCSISCSAISRGSSSS